MKRKSLFLTLVIAGALIVGSLPSVIGTWPPDIPDEDCWIVTDDVVDIDADEHNYYDEYPDYGGGTTESDHECVWYKDTTPPEPISDDSEWIFSDIVCSVTRLHDDQILTVVINGHGAEPATFYSETLKYTIINGALDAQFCRFSVRAIWIKGTSAGPSQEDETVHLYGGEWDCIVLDYCQEVDIELTCTNMRVASSPGQKEYWVVTEDVGGEANQWYVLTPRNPGTEMSEGVLNQVWWTDKQGPTVPIWDYDWHINTKCLVWAEYVNTNDARIYVKIYGESNYYPEMVNWTIVGARTWDPHFNLDIDLNGTDCWDINVLLDADPQFKEIGPIDNLDLEITFYGTDPDP